MRLKDKVAIVTGGAHGIGQAFIKGFAGEGAKVVIADIDYEAAKANEKELIAGGAEALALKVDVSSEADTLRMAKSAGERFGGIDILVNNASTVSRGGSLSRGTPFYELSLDAWNRLMAINVNGPFLCARAVFPYMKERGKGKIINMSSQQFYTGGFPVKYIHYLTSKGAVVSMTRALARELGDYNINVNCIAPGSTYSEEQSAESLKFREKSVANRCIKRVEYPEDLVGAAIFLASAESDFVSGQTIIVDGGTSFIAG